MNAFFAAIWIYVLTIVFALLIAALIRGTGGLVKALRLDRGDEPLDNTVPSSNSLREDEFMAVALATAHARHKKR